MDSRQSEANAMYTDFSKAFNKLNHNILILIFSQIGEHDILTRWLNIFNRLLLYGNYIVSCGPLLRTQDRVFLYTFLQCTDIQFIQMLLLDLCLKLVPCRISFNFPPYKRLQFASHKLFVQIPQIQWIRLNSLGR